MKYANQPTYLTTGYDDLLVMKQHAWYSIFTTANKSNEREKETQISIYNQVIMCRVTKRYFVITTHINGSFTWSPDRCDIPPIEFCIEQRILADYFDSVSLSWLDLPQLSAKRRKRKLTAQVKRRLTFALSFPVFTNYRWDKISLIKWHNYSPHSSMSIQSN